VKPLNRIAQHTGHAVFLRLANGVNEVGMKSQTLPRNSTTAATNGRYSRVLKATIFESD
jgi:hypothetical protein